MSVPIRPWTLLVEVVTFGRLVTHYVPAWVDRRLASPVQYMQSTGDTLEKLAVSELRKVAAALSDIVDDLDNTYQP